LDASTAIRRDHRTDASNARYPSTSQHTGCRPRIKRVVEQ
jgi:hypothetical protein